MTNRSPFVRRTSMIIAMIMAVIYLCYRGFYTLNLGGWYAGIASFSLYAAECYGCFLMFLYFFQIWDVRNPAPVPSLPDRAVDVFIPTYNEDPDLLRGTISAALKIEYPHKTWVLDDGKRPEVKALCEELGAQYVTRPSNIHAKAGNLNHALEITDGEFLIIFDADHVAEPHFIDRLIGYFADEKLGFIQTPHAFYNFDAYQGLLNYEKGVYWEEGMLFYNVTQPGKNRWNGVSFCGSAAMFRRQALEDVNLVATESITEDMHTGIRMHARGWGSLFVNERLIAAQAAPDITSFNTQRLRWGEGNLGIMGFDNPLTIKGLTLAQRLCYIGSMLSWSTGVQKLLIYIAPMLMLLTGIPPVINLSWTLGGLTLAYMVSVWTGVKIASNGYGKLWAIELTQMACFWTQVQATWRAIFNRKKANFVVTSKRGRQSNGVGKHIRPQIVYILCSTISIAWAVTRYQLRLSDDLVGLSIGSALLILHSWMAWVVIRRALRPSDQRYSWRHPAALAVSYSLTDSLGETVTGQGISRDINERGLGLLTFTELPESERITVTVTAGSRNVTCTAEVRWQKTIVNYRSRRDGLTQGYHYGLQFVDLTSRQLDTLWWLGAQYAVSRQYEKFAGGQFGLDPGQIVSLPAEKSEDTAQLPVMLELWDGGMETGVTETLGQRSFTVLLASKLDPGTAVELKMATPFGTVFAWATSSETVQKKIAGAVFHETRIEFVKFEDESRGMLTSTLGHATTRELAPLVRLAPRKAPLPALRPASTLAGAAALAAGLVVTVAVFSQRDAAVIARVNHGEAIGTADLDRLKAMVVHATQSDSVDEQRVLELRAALQKLDEDEEVATLDHVLAMHATHSLNGQVLKAFSLQNLGKADEAEKIFAAIMNRVEELPDEETRGEFLLAAARNAANLEQLPLAQSRFDRLWNDPNFRDIARLEYAGVLWKVGEIDRAIELLKTGAGTPREQHLLASIYASTKQFDKAIDTYQQLRKLSPEDLVAERGLADCYLWDGQYQPAIALYQKIVQRDGTSEELQYRLAQACLWSRNYPAAGELFAQLLDQQPTSRDYENGFLLAMAGQQRLSLQDEQRIRKLLNDVDRQSGDTVYLTNLLNAASRLENTAIVLPLLERLVAEHPEQATLRMRLADGLQELGRYNEAEKHYAWLLKHTASSKIRTSQRRPAGESQ